VDQGRNVQMRSTSTRQNCNEFVIGYRILDSSTFQDGAHQDICDVPLRSRHALRRRGFRGGCWDWALYQDTSVTSCGSASGRCGQSINQSIISYCLTWP